LRSHGVLAFEGYGVKLALSAPAQQEVVLTLDREEEEERGDSTLADLYSNPALWGGRKAPDFE
jgi:hypothetical protein